MKVQFDEHKSPGQQSSKLIEANTPLSAKNNEIHEEINENDGFDEFQNAPEAQKSPIEENVEQNPDQNIEQAQENKEIKDEEEEIGYMLPEDDLLENTGEIEPNLT